MWQNYKNVMEMIKAGLLSVIPRGRDSGMGRERSKKGTQETEGLYCN